MQLTRTKPWSNRKFEWTHFKETESIIKYLPKSCKTRWLHQRVLLLLRCFSCARLCVTPKTAAHQAPLSLGFSRQEYWSGLPFPSPVHDSEKWKWSCSVVIWLLATSWTAAYQAPPSMGFSRQEYWSGVPLPSPTSEFYQTLKEELITTHEK